MNEINIGLNEYVYDGQNRLRRNYPISLRLNLRDELSEDELKSRLSSTIKLVRDVINDDIKEFPCPQDVIDVTPLPHSLPPPKTSGGPCRGTKASKKQHDYVRFLAKRNMLDESDILNKVNATSMEELTKKQCGDLIAELKNSLEKPCQ